MENDRQATSGIPDGGRPSLLWTRLLLLIVFLYAAVIYLPFLGSARILTRHEVLLAHPAMRMLSEGSWLVPRYASRVWVDKPPLVTWVTAGLFAVSGGFNEFAARLPAALSAIGLCLIVTVLTRRFFDAKTALLAGLMQATFTYMFMQGRLGEIDMPFALFVVGALSVLVWHWGTGVMTLPLTSAMAFHTLAGLAVMTKGPLALGFFGMMVLCYCRARRSWQPLKSVLYTPAIACFFVIGFWWYVVAMTRVADTAMERWSYNNIARFLGLHHLGSQSFFLYFYTLPWLVLPWGALLFLHARRLVADARRPDAYLDRLIWSWFLGGLAILLLSAFKHKHYAIPILPPLTILCAKLAMEDLPRIRPHGLRVLVCVLIGAPIVFGIVGGVVMPRRDHRVVTVEFLRDAIAQVPPGEDLCLVGLAQSSVYPYVHHACLYADTPEEIQNALSNAAGKPLWILTFHKNIEIGEQYGLSLDVVAREPVRKKYALPDTLVLGRAVHVATRPATRATMLRLPSMEADDKE